MMVLLILLTLKFQKINKQHVVYKNPTLLANDMRRGDSPIEAEIEEGVMESNKATYEAIAESFRKQEL